MAKATTKLPRGAAAALLLLMGAALLAGPALAQVQPNPTVTVALDAASLDVDAGNTTLVQGTVANGGSLQGTVSLAVQAPEGWTVTVEPSSSFSLDAGQSVPVTLTLVAPAAGAGAAAGDVFLDATITDAAGRAGAAQANVVVTRVDPVIPPPPPPPYGLYAALAATAAAIVAGAILLWARARSRRLAAERAAAEEAARKAAHEAYLARETGIGISLLEGPVRFGTRRELVYRLGVENQSDRDRVALIGVAACPEGWTAASAFPKMPLKPGERVVVTFYVNPGDGVPGGAKAHVSFFAKPEEAQELDQRVAVEVAAPEPRVPDLGERALVTPREPVAPRPHLRL